MGKKKPGEETPVTVKATAPVSSAQQSDDLSALLNDAPAATTESEHGPVSDPAPDGETQPSPSADARTLAGSQPGPEDDAEVSAAASRLAKGAYEAEADAEKRGAEAEQRNEGPFPPTDPSDQNPAEEPGDDELSFLRREVERLNAQIIYITEHKTWPNPSFDFGGDEMVDVVGLGDDCEDDFSLPFDAVVLREGTVLQFNGADVTLPFDTHVVLPGSHDEASLAAVLVRDRANFALNKGLLQGEYNPQTGALVVRPREPVKQAEE